MTITDVRIKLCPGEDRLLAYAAATFDRAFVIRDLKLINGPAGVFVAMPSRPLTDRCPKCGGKVALVAKFCVRCGRELDHERATRDAGGRARLWADVAHPITAWFRIMLETAVVDAYERELVLAQSPSYVSQYDHYNMEDSGT